MVRLQSARRRDFVPLPAEKDAARMARLVDRMVEIVRGLDPLLEAKYNKFYIGLAKQGQPSNFVIFKSKKDWLRVEVRLPNSDDSYLIGTSPGNPQ
jgi:hypothetical protein